MASALYTTKLLRLAVEAASHPRLSQPDASEEARAPLCGSRIALDLTVDDQGRVSAIGFDVNACAVGQASAAILADVARGRSVEELRAAADSLTLWLNDRAAPMPDWPRLVELAEARAYPARHGAILLPWRAAATAAHRAAACKAGA
ncbi:iron-sulfur cluster assembly scaffold protein [Sphingomonas lacunae]|uniref:Iron-sulfur cluster assembly scaffold protein n=1 Tax=Sphingomonas lacunae TaxID=2698828 RepID=A0A6M4AUP3_9SPHN|nr:iron-sulfur cluster assembly scaffold protein [Sphingomonas lacunae]QJQ32426.1 iron-sulfur cluster assembly scaffold protein [Sphingomonas lacunae]